DAALDGDLEIVARDAGDVAHEHDLFVVRPDVDRRGVGALCCARPEGGTAHVVHHVVEETVQHREGSPCACHGCTSCWSCLRSPARLARASPPPVCLQEPINSVRTLSRARTLLTPLTMAR